MLSKVGIMGCQPYISQVFLEVAKVLILLCYECIVTIACLLCLKMHIVFPNLMYESPLNA